MNYYEMIKQISAERLALVEDGEPCTYGRLFELVEEKAEEILSLGKGEQTRNRIRDGRSLFLIKKVRILEQLTEFLAAQKLHKIPVILPETFSEKDFVSEKDGEPDTWLCEKLSDAQAKDSICMGVCTSGSKGVPKFYFRTYESWADYFPVQNGIFGVSKDSRLFAQGSLSFTGNLNLYLAQFSVGAAVVAQNAFAPKEWLSMMKAWKTDLVYLIPSKLMCLPRAAKEEVPFVKQILSGSQSLGKSDALKLQKIFPESRIFLYYGASELNYITYLTDEEMTEEKNLVGRAFPEVGVAVKDGEIYVDTKYHVCGISCPYTLSDTGYFDEQGRLHFTGRSDDVVLVRGRKISTYRIEQELMKLDEVEEAAVFVKEKEHLVAFVKAASSHMEEEGVMKKKLQISLKETLNSFEIPKRIFFVENMPKNASGKMDKTVLKSAMSFR